MFEDDLQIIVYNYIKLMFKIFIFFNSLVYNYCCYKNEKNNINNFEISTNIEDKNEDFKMTPLEQTIKKMMKLYIKIKIKKNQNIKKHHFIMTMIIVFFKQYFQI